jgi:hypothetical protein
MGLYHQHYTGVCQPVNDRLPLASLHDFFIVALDYDQISTVQIDAAESKRSKNSSINIVATIIIHTSS